MSYKVTGLVAILLAVGMSSGVFAAQESVAKPSAGAWVSGSGVSVTSGKYGTAQTTTLTQLSETLKYQGSTGEVGVVVPYLIRRGGGVTAGETTRARGTTIPNNASGLGDIRLKGKYYWLEEVDWRPAVDVAGWVKFPTASASDGLGTGRFDVGFGPDLVKRFGSLITFADLQAVLRDRPSGSTIKSTRFDYSVGVGYPLTSRFTGYVSLDGGTKSSTNSKAPLEVVFSGTYKMMKNLGLNGFISAGLSKGSPDVGAGAAITIRF